MAVLLAALRFVRDVALITGVALAADHLLRHGVH